MAPEPAAHSLPARAAIGIAAAWAVIALASTPLGVANAREQLVGAEYLRLRDAGSPPATAMSTAESAMSLRVFGLAGASSLWWGVGPALSLLLCMASFRQERRRRLWGGLFGTMVAGAVLKGFSENGKLQLSVASVGAALLVATILLTPVGLTAPVRWFLWKRDDRLKQGELQASEWQKAVEREQALANAATTSSDGLGDHSTGSN